MQIVMLLGKNSSALHGPFDARNLYKGRALTGSESSFFNLARGLKYLENEVTVYCDVVEPVDDAPDLLGASVYSINSPVRGDYDACIALNEPDLLRNLPTKAFHVVWQQFNDFKHAAPGFAAHVDAFVFLSPLHAEHVAMHSNQFSRSKVAWIPNTLVPIPSSDSLTPIVRDPHKAIWCSSPDRGLHRLLEMWPFVRKKVPDATLDIYYRIDTWLARDWGQNRKVEVRANYIRECLKRLGRNGESGVRVVGDVSNVAMWQALCGAGVLPYTCECIEFTEGFSVSVMDACRAGCVPVISDADAIGDIYAGVAWVIPSRPSVIAVKDDWIEAIVKAMTDWDWASGIVRRAEEFARKFEWNGPAVRMWQKLLERNTRQKYRQNQPDLDGMPSSIGEFVKTSREKEQEREELPMLENTAVDDDEEEAELIPFRKPEPRKVEGTPTIQCISPKLRIAIILGSVSRAVHGIFDVDKVYESGQSMTGTGTNFFNLVWGLAERGHTVDAFTDLVDHRVGCAKLGGANLYNRESVVISDDYDAYISVNEPDLLRECPSDKLRILQMQLNDFTYATAGFDRSVDLYVCPSDRHAHFLAKTQNLDREKVFALPLSINAEFFGGYVEKRKHSIAYCSSPDRGLHHLMKIFPMVRKQIPDATLHVYYQTKPWIEQILNSPQSHMEMKKRASMILEGMTNLGEEGKNGLHMHGPVPTKTMAMELQKAEIFAYPCDTIYFTEGFSVSIMDACAAGCFPIVAPTDALPDVYTGVVRFIEGRPSESYQEWADEIVRAMSDLKYANLIRHTAHSFAMQHTRQKIAKMWETLIRERKKS